MFTNINKDYQEINLKLVGEVEKRPALYNFKLPEFTRKSVTDQLWQEVADEMEMPVIEVKEKWRNLRSVYMRKLRHGSEGKKKAYYLENAMKFCLPFIKFNNPSGNHTPTQLNTTVGNLQLTTEEIVDSIETCEDNKFQITFPQSSPTRSTSPNASKIKTFPQTIGTLPAQTKDRLAPSQPVKFTLPAQGNKLFILRNKKTANTDHQYVADYLRPKRAKTLADEAASSSKTVDRHQSIKMFLLSLMPELEELSDYQIKLFKRRVFCIIDEVSNNQD